MLLRFFKDAIPNKWYNFFLSVLKLMMQCTGLVLFFTYKIPGLSRTFPRTIPGLTRTFLGLKVKVSTYKNHVPSTQQCYNSLLYALTLFVKEHLICNNELWLFNADSSILAILKFDMQTLHLADDGLLLIFKIHSQYSSASSQASLNLKFPSIFKICFQ